MSRGNGLAGPTALSHAITVTTINHNDNINNDNDHNDGRAGGCTRYAHYFLIFCFLCTFRSPGGHALSPNATRGCPPRLFSFNTTRRGAVPLVVSFLLTQRGEGLSPSSFVSFQHNAAQHLPLAFCETERSATSPPPLPRTKRETEGLTVSPIPSLSCFVRRRGLPRHHHHSLTRNARQRD